jgi:beta-galactosidase
MWNGVQTGNDGMSDHWQRVEGQKLSIVTYTNAEEVELLLNGKSLGKQKNDVKNAKMRNQIRWNNVEYKPGRLVAIARNGGKEVARHQIETTGEAVSLTAEADKPMATKKNKNVAKWNADGMDLQHVRIVAVDKKGRRVPMAQQEVTFSVDGPAEIVGVINGDINSDELTVGQRRSLYQGTCTVILRSTREAGNVTLKATCPGMKEVLLKCTTLS